MQYSGPQGVPQQRVIGVVIDERFNELTCMTLYRSANDDSWLSIKKARYSGNAMPFISTVTSFPFLSSCCCGGYTGDSGISRSLKKRSLERRAVAFLTSSSMLFSEREKGVSTSREKRAVLGEERGGGQFFTYCDERTQSLR